MSEARRLLRRHRWWLALVALLLTPWPGPHVDTYLPLVWVLVRAGGEAADGAFWVLAAVLLVAGYGAWLLFLSILAVWLPRGRTSANPRDVPRTPGGKRPQ